MTEWGVVLVIISLIGLLSAVTAPIIKLNTAIVKLTVKLDDIIKGNDDFRIRYTDNMKFLKHTDEHLQEQIDEHEHRITVLEEHKMEGEL